jgi:hypothetical protein
MKFYVVPVPQNKDIPPMASRILGHIEASVFYGQHVPIVLCCDFMTGQYAGVGEGQDVYFLNDDALGACREMNLQYTEIIDDSALPKKYVLVAGPGSANYKERIFEERELS